MATEIAVLEVETKAVSLRDRARALIVVDQATHDVATELYLGLSALSKEIDSVHDPAISAAHTSHKAALAAKAKSAGPVEEAKRIIKPKIMQWEEAEERRRQEIERKIHEEAARKHAEEERIAREQAEKARQEAARIEEEERLRLAAQAEQAGATKEQVDEILDTPVYVAPDPEPYVPAPFVPPTVAQTYQKTAGFTSRWNYSAQVADFGELCRAAAQNSSFLPYLQADQTAINGLARATKEAFNLPGCKLIKTKV